MRCGRGPGEEGGDQPASLGSCLRGDGKKMCTTNLVDAHASWGKTIWSLLRERRRRRDGVKHKGSASAEETNHLLKFQEKDRSQTPTSEKERYMGKGVVPGPGPEVGREEKKNEGKHRHQVWMEETWKNLPNRFSESWKWREPTVGGGKSKRWSFKEWEGIRKEKWPEDKK